MPVLRLHLRPAESQTRGWDEQAVLSHTGILGVSDALEVWEALPETEPDNIVLVSTGFQDGSWSVPTRKGEERIMASQGDLSPLPTMAGEGGGTSTLVLLCVQLGSQLFNFIYECNIWEKR